MNAYIVYHGGDHYGLGRYAGPFASWYSADAARLECLRTVGGAPFVEAVCQAVGLIFHHQTDPRGAALYVGTQAELGDRKPCESYSTSMVCCWVGGRE